VVDVPAAPNYFDVWNGARCARGSDDCDLWDVGSGVASALGNLAEVGAVAMVSARGGKFGYVVRSRHKAYRALRAKGFTKTVAAKIANAGRTLAGRKQMARKGARRRR
jgi:hypothetical protein